MKMVDVGQKNVTRREAIACATVYLSPEVISIVKEKKLPKGDCLEAARLAGILAAKKTSSLIPLCHPIGIEYARIEFALGSGEVAIKTLVRAEAKTGVEMEALTAACVAALTIYDMCKPIDKTIVISEIKLLKKTGGKSGVYIRKE